MEKYSEEFLHRLGVIYRKRKGKRPTLKQIAEQLNSEDWQPIGSDRFTTSNVWMILKRYRKLERTYHRSKRKNNSRSSASLVTVSEYQ